jgi:hypothetical protein
MYQDSLSVPKMFQQDDTLVQYFIIRRAQMKVGLRLERRYSQRSNFAISPGDGSVCQETLDSGSVLLNETKAR